MNTKTRTKNISKSVILDAISVAYGMMGMNAKYAVGYAFVGMGNGKEVATGEFVWPSEISKLSFSQFDGFIDFKKETLVDLETNEQILIKNFI